MSQCHWTSWMECLKRNHVNNIEGNNKVLLFVSWCSHLGCIFWRFHCILLVYIRRWGWLVTRNLINHYALLWLAGFQQLWLVHFDPCCFVELFSQWSAFFVSWSWASMLLEFQFHYPCDVVNRLFDPVYVPMQITINKVYLIPKQIVSGVGGVCSFILSFIRCPCYVHDRQYAMLLQPHAFRTLHVDKVIKNEAYMTVQSRQCKLCHTHR